MGPDAEQAKLDGQEFGLPLGVSDVGVEASDKSGDDLLALGVVVVHIEAQVAARSQQAGTNVAVKGLGALNLGHCASHPTTPDFELRKTLTGGVIALGKEQVVLICRVDVSDAPAIGKDFNRFVEAGDLHGGAVLLGPGSGRLRTVARRLRTKACTPPGFIVSLAWAYGQFA